VEYLLVLTFVFDQKLCLCESDEEFAKRVATFCTRSDRPNKRLAILAQNRETEQKKQSQGRVLTRSQSQSNDNVPQKGRLQIGMPVVMFQDGGKQFKGFVRWLGDIYVQKTPKEKGKSNTALMPIAGIEMVSKRDIVIGLEGIESQKHAQFHSQHGGQKVYFPVDSVMPELEYKDSLQNTPQNVASKEQFYQQQTHSGLRKPSGESKEDKELEGVPTHLLGGLNTKEVMQQQHQVMNQAA
jgi:hypothetical protein